VRGSKLETAPWQASYKASFTSKSPGNVSHPRTSMLIHML